MSGKTIAALLDERAADSADRPFVTCAGETVTYGEFADRTQRLAGALRDLGIGPGDKLCLFLRNGLPFALAMFAAARLGVLFVPAHAQLRAGELRYVVSHSDAVAIVTDRERSAVVEDIRRDCPVLRHVIVVDAPSSRSALAFDDLLRAPPAVTSSKAGDEDAAAILYTSGTTGRPKGVLLRHSGYLMNATGIAERTMLSSDDVLYCVLPLAHLNAQRSSLLAAAVAGAHLILAERFSASSFWPTVRAQKVSFFSIMPAIVAILLRQAPDPDDRKHCVRLCLTPITPPLLEAFESRFGILVVNTYGLTEGMLNVMNYADSRRRRDAIGQPLMPQVHRLRIVDDGDIDVPRGATGEILLQSPAMMIGYYKDPEATQQALRGGWLHTGDLGYLEDGDFLHFVARRKELIRRAGENVAPAEIESVLSQHPAVLEAVAVAVPDPILEEEIKACVILREGYDSVSAPPTELFAFCASRLAAFKVPRYLEYRRDFPRTPTLRVERHKLASKENGTQIFDRLAVTS